MAARGRIGWMVVVAFLLGGGERAWSAEGPAKYLKKPAAWFGSPEARTIADHILSHQSALGGWPKNIDTTAKASQEPAEKNAPTFDNGATTDELRFLARVLRAKPSERDQAAFLRGLEYILTAQYANGGWPQSAPPPKSSYPRHITFNDNAMVRLMRFLRDVERDPEYAFLDASKRQQCRQAFDRGIDCILRCQVKVKDKLTVWCAQHDEVDFRPRPARKYELVSLSGAESVEITRLLMSLDSPTPAVVAAIEGAIAWFESARLTGIRVVTRDDPKAPQGKDKVVIPDPAAPPLWARFYEIETNRPFFCDRDGVKKYALGEIGYERRNGYAWYGHWPEKLLATEYPAWKARHAAPKPR